MESDETWLDPELARIYDEEAQKLMLVLRESAQKLRGAANITGLGDFRFADQVAKAFSDYLGGESNSIAATLDQYADVAGQMRDEVNRAMNRTVHQDDENRQALNRIDPS